MKYEKYKLYNKYKQVDHKDMQNIDTFRDGPKALAKEITRGEKYQQPKCQPSQFSAVIGRPGSDEPGQPITELNQDG